MINIETQASGARQYLALQREVGRESLSGPGSAMEATDEVRQWLIPALAALGVRTLADVPCGDWHWISGLDFFHAGIEVCGYDILGDVIRENRSRFPGVMFRELNAIVDAIPLRPDAILSRDFIVHLSLDHGRRVVANFRKSGARYTILTTYPGAENAELAESHPGWGWRPLDMEAEPFSLEWTGQGIRETKADARDYGRRLRVYHNR